jgi:sarcosine oxidase subunit gamma
MSESTTVRHGLEPFLSALPKRSSGGDCMKVRIQADLGHINLRGSTANSDFLAAVAGVLRQELPLVANTMTMGDHRVFWLGPDEWQIVTAIDNTAGLVTRLGEALVGLHASATDLSGGQIAMRISGPGVPDVLAKACTLDLAPAEFEMGACAQSGLAKASMLIGRIDAEPVYEIVVRRSFADYVVRWLQQAAADYGVEFSASQAAL